MLATTQPSSHVRDLLAELYLGKTGKVLPVYQMVFDTPIENTNDFYDGDTLLVCTHTLGSGNFGKKTLVYNRLNLEYSAGTIPSTIAGTTLYENLQSISEAFGIEITENDVLDSALVNGDTFTLAAKPESYIYKGQGQITFV